MTLVPDPKLIRLPPLEFPPPLVAILMVATLMKFVLLAPLANVRRPLIFVPLPTFKTLEVLVEVRLNLAQGGQVYRCCNLSAATGIRSNGH